MLIFVINVELDREWQWFGPYKAKAPLWRSRLQGSAEGLPCNQVLRIQLLNKFVSGFPGVPELDLDHSENCSSPEFIDGYGGEKGSV